MNLKHIYVLVVVMFTLQFILFCSALFFFVAFIYSVLICDCSVLFCSHLCFVLFCSVICFVLLWFVLFYSVQICACSVLFCSVLLHSVPFCSNNGHDCFGDLNHVREHEHVLLIMVYVHDKTHYHSVYME